MRGKGSATLRQITGERQSNSHGVVAAGINAHITYQVTVGEGDVLTACATEVSLSAKLAVYRVDVTRGDGAVASSFTSSVYVTKRPHAAQRFASG